jgi:hypothetical protein
MISQKHIRKAIFVFKDGEFLCKYDGVMDVERALNISHETIKKKKKKYLEENHVQRVIDLVIIE